MAIITAANLKTYLGIDGTQHNTTVDYAAAAANAAVMRHCGRRFDKVAVAAETARVYARTSRGQWRGIESPYTAVIHDLWDTTNLVVKTDAGDDGTYETTWSAADFQLEPLNQLDGDSYSPYWRIRAVGSHTFPVGNAIAALQVTAAWGWAAVPSEVTQATLLKAARLWHRKDSPQGVAGFGDFGVVRITRAQDPDVADLLDPFRHPVMVAASMVA